MKTVWLILLFFISLILQAGCSKKEAKLLIGQAAIEFNAPTPAGDMVSLKDFNGKIILVHFWADWCSNCRAEFPKLESAYKNLGEQNFEIVAVNVAQSKNHVVSFVDTYGLTFPMLLDPQAVIAKLYGIKGLPTNIFINSKFKIVKVIIGWVDEEQIRQILKQITTKE